MAGKRFWLASLGFAMLLVAVYVGVSALDIPLLQHPSAAMRDAGRLAAVLSVALLVGDILLPLPSSVIMVANGALFGVVGGTLVSLVGRSGAFLFGYWLGARSLPLARRWISAQELEAARRQLERNGWLAIMLSRPVPVMSETVAVVAGLSSMPLGRSLAAAVAGSVPEAMVLAAAARYLAGLDAQAYAFVALLLVTGLAWLLWRRA